MEKQEIPTNLAKSKLLRCLDWLRKQNQELKKESLKNKNDIQFIIQTNADRKNFLLAAAEDEASVPVGIDEPLVEPKAVPIRRLRIDSLRLECEWQSCQQSTSYQRHFTDYEQFQIHIKTHVSDVHVIKKEGCVDYVCLWDVCGHKTADLNEMVRHINYHAYHARLLAIGFNGRATLKLVRCKKDSSKRNQLPPLKSPHRCMWIDCDDSFDSIQHFFDHVRYQHTSCAEKYLCSWAGCGATFPKRITLTMHVRSHTGERLIACYHCGQHFSCNRKLCDHLRRQNVYGNGGYGCTMCGVTCATQYLLREHARQHVSAYACAYCDMSSPTPAGLAHHIRYRHLSPTDTRNHACPHCEYRAVTNWDLQKHILTHKKRKIKEEKGIKKEGSDKEISDEDNSDEEVPAKKKSTKKYACHICPKNKMIIFSRGSRLTTHLVKEHGAQWPFGHSRFRYQISDDGMYRLTTTRYELIEVSKKIVECGPKESLTNTFEFNLNKIAEANQTTPIRFEVTLKDELPKKVTKAENKVEDNEVEITMCDVDEDGNIIKSEVICSDVFYG